MPCIMREHSRLSVVIYALCYKRYGCKVEDKLKFGLKSSCCDNKAVMQMSAIDYQHVIFALELISY